MVESTAHMQQVVDKAVEEIHGLYQAATTNKPVKGWTVSDSTDKLIAFKTKYAARLTANAAIGTERELRDQLIDDLKDWLRFLYALKDYVSATQPTDPSQINLKAAMDRYTQRSRALELVLNSLLGAHASLETVESIDEARSKLYQLAKGKSEREIFQIVSRVLPTEEEIDGCVTELLYILIVQAHTEPAVQALVTDENSLINPNRLETGLREFASSQELRDYVGPYLAALIKKALSEEGVEAYDDAFRNTYFAVVNRVQNYYQTAPKAPERSAISDQRLAPSAPPPPPPAPKSEVIPLSAIEPLVTETQAETAALEDIPQIKGTGLE